MFCQNMKQKIKCFLLLMLTVFSLFSMVGSALAAPAQTARRGAKIVVTFRNIPAEDKGNVDGEYYVSQLDGTIALPYLSGSIKAEGKTAQQLEAIIKARYMEEEIYAQPIVTAQVGDAKEIEALNQRYVQVTGYVGRKANLPYRPDLTLIQALIECGDITDYGSRYIQVSRGSQTQTYDYFSARDRSLKLQPNDVIFVRLRGSFEGRPSKVGP